MLTIVATVAPQCASSMTSKEADGGADAARLMSTIMSQTGASVPPRCGALTSSWFLEQNVRRMGIVRMFRGSAKAAALSGDRGVATGGRPGDTLKSAEMRDA